MDDHLLSFRTLKNNVDKILLEVEDLTYFIGTEENEDMLFLNKCSAYLMVSLAKDTNFELTMDEIEQLVNNLTDDFNRKDISAAMISLNR